MVSAKVYYKIELLIKTFLSYVNCQYRSQQSLEPSFKTHLKKCQIRVNGIEHKDVM